MRRWNPPRWGLAIPHRCNPTGAPLSVATVSRRRCIENLATDSARTYDDQISLAVPTSARFNELGIQQLSAHLHPQVFSEAPRPPPEQYISLAKSHLQRHDLLGKNQDQGSPIGVDLPQLQGGSLDEHFHRLGLDASEPYLTLAKDFARANPPPRPRSWVKRSGWTKYYRDGSSEAVDAPNESALAFDTEVMYKETSFPAMACAHSASAWYGWISPWLLGESDTDRHLIPLGDPSQPRIVVGHNIGYDRARVLEEYDLAQSRNYFMDTMSLHVAVNGMCTRQRPTWMKHNKARNLREEIANSTQGADLHELLRQRDMEDEEEHLWISRSSVNSLRDVAQFHCGITIDKSRREWFGELDRQGILEKFDELLDYCAADVDITHKVYRRVFPAFLETCPHPVSFAALRHLSAEILPVNETWQKYLHDAEETYHKSLEHVQQRLLELCDRALEIKSEPERYQSDPWLRQLDWSGQEIKMTKAKKKGEEPRPAKRQKKPGMPRWYRDLFMSNDSPISLTVRTRIAPLLLRMAWEGNPLVWSDKHGWTFKVSLDKAASYDGKPVVEADMAEEENPLLREDADHKYFKLPHKDGPTARCANPLAKGYLQHFENGTLHSEYALAKEALDMNASCSYWISARDRIRSQMVVYERDVSTTSNSKDNKVGFILPQVVPMGTITRRAVENTWLTASNAKKNRVGSELKSIITAPPGFCFVGADVDSQELWIASLMGDAQFKLHGGNAIGFMTLEGSKSAGTDLHSRTASILGISRNDAKVFNYGRIYGAGLPFASALLKQFNPSLTDTQAGQTATTLYTSTKGVRTLRKKLHDRSFWRNGTESLVFNTLEDFAEQDRPRTPVLGAGITEALLRRFVSKGEFMTSRVNWAIQSSGVDYLHLLIVAMDYLSRRYNLAARLAITVHDEIRYLVREEDKYRAAMALQVANIWTRAFFAQQVGIADLPQAVAFFSAVDIDHVLRKEVDMDCITPSHPTAIPAGESLSVDALLAKGKEAYLDPVITPSTPIDVTHYEYQPREPVMQSLQKATSFHYLRAQVANDDELRDIIRDQRSSDMPSPITRRTSDSNNTSSTSRTTSPRGRKPRNSTSSSTKSTKEAAATPLPPQGISLPEAPWWAEVQRRSGWERSRQRAFGNGKGWYPPGNGAGANRTGRGGYSRA